jgi:hypothetical protein
LYSETISQFSEFDDESIMLYSIPNEFTLGDYEVGWNTVLSDMDKGFIGVMYPKESSGPVELEVDADPYQASIGVHGEEDHYTFNVDYPGTYRVRTGGWTDVVMYLYGPEEPDTFIGMDDDSGFLRNASLTTDLVPGQYFVMVRHFRPKRTGNYNIAVELRK